MTKIFYWPDGDWVREEQASESVLFQIKSDDYGIILVAEDDDKHIDKRVQSYLQMINSPI